jgi:hypothetical protein
MPRKKIITNFQIAICVRPFNDLANLARRASGKDFSQPVGRNLPGQIRETDAPCG